MEVLHLVALEDDQLITRRVQQGAILLVAVILGKQHVLVGVVEIAVDVDD